MINCHVEYAVFGRTEILVCKKMNTVHEILFLWQIKLPSNKNDKCDEFGKLCGIG